VELPRDGSVVMFMLVRTPAGRPTGYPMTGLFSDGVLQVTTYRKAAKARYLLADDRVCCVVPDPDDMGVGVRLVGRAVPTEVSGFAASTRSNSAAIDVPDEVRATVRDRLDSDKRMVFRIDVERIEQIGVPA
jgi:hypothetical protein